MLPCLLFEDDHLLVVHKPARLNTHSPSPFAGEGIYDWLRNRESRWGSLAILHRLDKDTSGVMVFGKTPLANRSLTRQFTTREVRKKYLLLTDRPPRRGDFTVRSFLARAGQKYVSGPGGEEAITRFVVEGGPRPTPFGSESGSPVWTLTAEPQTGRTHQIRVHAADSGIPILGDTLYGGAPARRVCLHAASISFKHPESGKTVVFEAPPDFSTDPHLALRNAVIDPDLTNAYRLVHGAGDGQPGWFVDKLGTRLLSQSQGRLNDAQSAELRRLSGLAGADAASHKILSRHVRGASAEAASPQPVLGAPDQGPFTIRENGLSFELSFGEGYSVGLFLDQRENRRRLLTGYVGPGFSLASARAPVSPARVLNTFAYTCAFSVCAAKNGFHTTSLDLSKKYLDWGRRNFALNNLDSSDHDFIYGDTFDWLHRLAKKGRAFEVVLLDPPTFSQSKVSGLFRAERDYARLVCAALPLLGASGVLFASCNASGWAAEAFLEAVEAGVRKAGRQILQQHYIPQPPDFPVSRAEPAYLKTVWIRLK